MNFSFFIELEELFFYMEAKKITFHTYQRLLRSIETIVKNEIIHLIERRSVLLKITYAYFKHFKHIDLQLLNIFIKELGNESIIDLLTNLIYEINNLSIEILTRIFLFFKRLLCDKHNNLKITEVFFECLF